MLNCIVGIGAKAIHTGHKNFKRRLQFAGHTLEYLKHHIEILFINFIIIIISSSSSNTLLCSLCTHVQLFILLIIIRSNITNLLQLDIAR